MTWQRVRHLTARLLSGTLLPYAPDVRIRSGPHLQGPRQPKQPHIRMGAAVGQVLSPRRPWLWQRHRKLGRLGSRRVAGKSTGRACPIERAPSSPCAERLSIGSQGTSKVAQNKLERTVAYSETWLTLSPDRSSVRFHLPPIPIAGLPEPLRLHVDFDRIGVDEVVGRLRTLRDKLPR